MTNSVISRNIRWNFLPYYLVMFELKLGKAPDANGLTAENLIRAHPILPVIFSKLFQLVLLRKQVLVGFGHSYIVPVPKSTMCSTKDMTCEDFRGIAISPIISQLFEYCNMDVINSSEKKWKNTTTTLRYYRKRFLIKVSRTRLVTWCQETWASLRALRTRSPSSDCGHG